MRLTGVLAPTVVLQAVLEKNKVGDGSTVLVREKLRCPFRSSVGIVVV